MSLDFQTKILVVEDFNLTRRIEIEILNKLGFHNLVEAVSGESAILKLKQEKDIGLIISDWNMPHKNGYDLLTWVRSHENYHKVPFIMVTARAEKKELEKAVSAGVSNFITKPFNGEELKHIIEETFGMEKQIQDIHEKIKPRKTDLGKIRLNVGHIQITDHLILGVLMYLIGSGNLTPKYFELETRCMSGWNPMQRALEKGEVDAGLILAPIAMDLFSFGVPIKLVLLAHKNGSICVRNRRSLTEESFRDFFINKIFYIPHVLSVHHMLSNMFFLELGLKPGLMGNKAVDVVFEVIPPVKMAELMGKSPEVSGFMVAQPVGAKAVAEGGAELMFLSGELWEHHPCCVVAMQEDIVSRHPDAVHEFIDMLVQSGMFVEQNPEKSAQIAAEFLDPEKKLNLSVPILKNVIMEPQGIKTDDLFPVIEDFDRMQRYMKEKMGIGTLIDLEKFVDTQFAEAICDKSARSSVFHDVSDIVWKIYKSEK